MNSKKNENNFFLIFNRDSLLITLLIIAFIYLRYRNIYLFLQIAIYVFLIIYTIYKLIKIYMNDKKNNTSNFKEKIIVTIILLILFLLSYFIIPLIIN